MNKHGFFKTINLVLITLLATTFVFAKITTETVQLVEKNLTEQLKQDLSEKSLTIELKNIEEVKSSNSQVNLVGKAFCILESEDTKLPIEFQAVISKSENKVLNITYEFVREEPVSLSVMSNEEMIARTVIEEIHKDIDTTNIVLTINSLKKDEASNKLVGFGEVKLGDFNLKTIKFDVEMDKSDKPIKVNSYQLGSY